MTVIADSSLHLKDGRCLGYVEFGDRFGSPVFYFHGYPGSRLEAGLANDYAMRHNIRLIGIDRPGYGNSDPKPGRRLTDWAYDVTELADRLAIKRFAVLAVSGGGPYAAACAYAVCDRLTSVGIVCGLGPIASPLLLTGMTPINRLGLRLIKCTPALARYLIPPALMPLRLYPGRILQIAASGAKEPEKSAIKYLQTNRVMGASFKEALRSGMHGAVSDLILYSQPWGFSLSEIHTRVHIWHGEKDSIVPAVMGRLVAGQIPNCLAAFYPAEGHVSLIVNHLEDFLGVLK